MKLGGFLTDCDGNTPSTSRRRPTLLRDINAAIDAVTGTVIDFSTAVGASRGAGLFLAYSRGPYSYDNPAYTCPWPTTFNTTTDPYDPDITGTHANPVVDLATDNIQYVSGFSR